jgi:membrane protease YdiL (CAAX protease family)
MLYEFSDHAVEPVSRTAPSRTEQAVELAVFLFLIVPSLVLSLFVVQQGSGSFVLVSVAVILRDLALVCLIWFFLWRNREPLVRIGWTARHWFREALLGIVLFVPVFFGAAALEWLLQGIGLSGPAPSGPSFLNERGPIEAVLAVVLVAVVAVSEETIFRGYLILRLGSTLRSMTAALLVSSAVFAVGHGYEGSAGLVTVGVLGLVFAVVYVWRGSLVAPIVMHFLQDFLSIVLVPLLLRQ